MTPLVLVVLLASAPLPKPLQDIDIVEKLGDRVPLELSFTDAQGHAVTLKELTSEREPILLTLGYQRCPMLCNLLLTGLVRSLQQTRLKLGEDFRAVSVSIDPSESTATAAEHQRGTLQSLGQGNDPTLWPFLTGSEPNIRALADAVGFKYAYDPQSKQFAHDAAAFILTPDGRVARYVYGVEFTGRDLKLALIEASGGRIGTSFDRFLLACFQWDPASRRYGLVMRRFLQGGGVAVFLALAGMLGVLWRRELKHHSRRTGRRELRRPA